MTQVHRKDETFTQIWVKVDRAVIRLLGSSQQSARRGESMLEVWDALKGVEFRDNPRRMVVTVETITGLTKEVVVPEGIVSWLDKWIDAGKAQWAKEDAPPSE